LKGVHTQILTHTNTHTHTFTHRGIAGSSGKGNYAYVFVCLMSCCAASIGFITDFWWFSWPHKMQWDEAQFYAHLLCKMMPHMPHISWSAMTKRISFTYTGHSSVAAWLEGW